MAGPCRPLVLVLLALASADGAGVRRVDFRDAATRRKLKRRTHGSLERPIVVQHALQGLEALRELATPAAIGALTPQLEGVKEGAAGTKLFCYWEKSAAAGFGRELATVAKRPWHAWTRRAAPMATAEFFWNSSGAVSRYWTDKISSQQSLGVDVQLLLCERLADSDSLEACLNADAAEARRFESGDADSTGLGSIESLWLSSKGTTAQLHYDMQANIFVQLAGRKKFRLFAPSQLHKVCLHPNAYPGSRQAQMDLGEASAGQGAVACGIDGDDEPPLFKDVVLEPGDVLLLPPYYGHHVEALDPSISYNVWWPTAESKGRSMVFDEMRAQIDGLVKPDGPAAAASMKRLSRMHAIGWRRYDALCDRGGSGLCSEQPSDSALADFGPSQAVCAPPLPPRLRAAVDAAAAKIVELVLSEIVEHLRELETLDMADNIIGMLHQNKALSLRSTRAYYATFFGYCAR